jgi:hypothetical protein
MQEHPHNDRETPQYWPKQMPFRIPTNYFAQQRKEVLEALQHEWNTHPKETAGNEIDRLSPLLGELKRKGINGRWHQHLPIREEMPEEKEEMASPSHEKTPVKSMKMYRVWAAAAAISGLLLMAKFFINQPDADNITVNARPSYGTMTDTIGISDEDIRSYLMETAEFPIEHDRPLSPSSNPEPDLAYADLLTAPEVFTTQMDAIPMHELEAYIIDVPAMNN